MLACATGSSLMPKYLLVACSLSISHSHRGQALKTVLPCCIPNADANVHAINLQALEALVRAYTGKHRITPRGHVVLATLQWSSYWGLCGIIISMHLDSRGSTSQDCCSCTTSAGRLDPSSPEGACRITIALENISVACNSGT